MTNKLAGIYSYIIFFWVFTTFVKVFLIFILTTISDVSEVCIRHAILPMAFIHAIISDVVIRAIPSDVFIHVIYANILVFIPIAVQVIFFRALDDNYPILAYFIWNFIMPSILIYFTYMISLSLFYFIQILFLSPILI